MKNSGGRGGAMGWEEPTERGAGRGRILPEKWRETTKKWAKKWTIVEKEVRTTPTD